MDFSQAIAKAITESVNVEFSEERVNDFVILAPGTEVSRSRDFYYGKSIIQIKGSKGKSIDFVNLKSLYDDLALFKGDSIFVCHNGVYKGVTFHHMYKFPNEEARIISHDVDGEEVNIKWTEYVNHL